MVAGHHGSSGKYIYSMRFTCALWTAFYARRISSVHKRNTSVIMRARDSDELPQVLFLQLVRYLSWLANTTLYFSRAVNLGGRLLERTLHLI
jgi:hypothetical protein